MPDPDRTALVLGATGGIGGATARRLLDAGWHVRALVRPSSRSAPPPGCEPVPGDAMDPAAVHAAAAGTAASGPAALLVHAVSPPGYRDWDRVVLPMLDNSIAAAAAAVPGGARLFLPGTLYNYAPETAPPLIDEDTPQRPTTAKGAIRAEMERRLRAAAADERIRALILRTGDFFGPDAGNSWFSQGMVPLRRRDGRPRVILDPVRRRAGHQWAYLPDVAETVHRLLSLPDLEPFAAYNMAGHWDPDGRLMPAAIRRAAIGPDRRRSSVPSILPFPWSAVRLLAPLNVTAHEMLELRPLWRHPVRLSNRRLLARLGTEPHTPLDAAVRATLDATRR